MTMLRSVACFATLLSGALGHAAAPNPRANQEALVLTDHARFTVLTSGLVRMEWSPTGTFEDRASHTFINRDTPPVEFKQQRDGDSLVIKTAALNLRYTDNGQPFSSKNLQIRFEAGGKAGEWFPGEKNLGDLRGTWRTLDGVSGPSNLEPGLLSREGWTLIDDSARLLFDDSDWPWAVQRSDAEALDWYFFAYGNDYPRALRDFTLVAGQVPLPPRYVFGTWWSRYWAYSDAELRELVHDFQEHNVPLDVLVIDMDWHLDGWTGYTWNPEYFPDPEGFLDWTAQQNLLVPLNLHPADGVGRHERAFPEMCHALGLDPATTEKIPFDCTDRAFVDAYFEFLHHPLERQGIDFWWTDWQQGTNTKIPGLDPLFWLNYLHWTDWERDAGAKAERPLIFSRWGGLGNHRYQVGFSGDTYCDWQSLAFQPYFTATAGNVGYGYWSHDIGGHQPGPVDPELYLRWIQWGALSPVIRTHTTKNPLAERRIWAFGEFFEPMREAWHLRYRLIPYIYTMARKTTDTALPLCRPLYYEWPTLDQAYQHPEAYLFGDDLYVAPVATPANPDNRCASVSVWLPPGDWVHWFTGARYAGPTDVELLVPRDEIPLFVRAGAIIPQAPLAQTTAEIPEGNRTLVVFPGERGRFELYDDDGRSRGYQRDESMRTVIANSRAADEQTIRIGEGNGTYEGRPAARSYEIVLRDTLPPRSVAIDGQQLPETDGNADEPGWHYDTERLSVVIHTGPRPLERAHKIEIAHSGHERLEAYLARGLRGQVRLGRTIHASVDDLAPPPVEDLATIGTLIRNDLDQAADKLDHITKVVYRIAASLRKINAENPELAEYVARLIGFRARLELQPGEKEGQLDAIAHLVTDPPLGDRPISGIRRAAKLSTPGNWKAATPSQTSSQTPSGDEVLSIRTTLSGQPRGVLQPARLAAELVIEDEASKLTLPIETTLLPSINGWWLVGPFERAQMPLLDQIFAPRGEIDASREWPGKDEQMVRWRKVQRTIGRHEDLGNEFFINFTDVYGGRVYDAAAYALVYLDSPDARDAQLALGSDDGIRVWLNHEQVFDNQVGRAYSSREDIVPIKLEAGRNVLCLRIGQQGGDWAFAAHLETPDGEPMTDVAVKLE